MPEARRTIVKSPPELWAEVSDPDSLAKHLEPFGEIRITRAEPESTVAWEGDRARGTVELAASGWGTKVTLSAEPVVEEAPVAEEPVVEEPPAAGEPAAAEEAPRRRGFFARLFGRRREEAVAAEPPGREPEVPPAAQPEVAGLGDDETTAVLDGMLDTLGAAHHRPFSR
jgi:hypothetical protein